MEHRRLPYERDDHGVVTIRLEQPDRKVIVLDWELLRRLDATLDDIGDDIGGLVLASETRVFVAGADLAEIDGLTDDQLDEYLAFGQRVFGRISALPCTSVAAIDGAALGGGLEIAMHCDHLLGLRPGPDERPYQVGLPECGLAICPGWGGTNLLPARIDPAQAISLTSSGRTFTADDALKSGLFEGLYDTSEDLMTAARDLARQAKPSRSQPGEPFHVSQAAASERVSSSLESVRSTLANTDAASAVVECIDAGLTDGWQAALDCERRCLIRLRNSEEGRSRVQAFLSKSASKS